tara:strand:- start:292 stop:465 length:174 start_codon:yes stop_codon:yes gene_type:complete
MKISKSSSNLSEQKNVMADETNNIRHGITKRLMEKYKPKGNYNIFRIKDRKDNKIVA